MDCIAFSHFLSRSVLCGAQLLLKCDDEICFLSFNDSLTCYVMHCTVTSCASLQCRDAMLCCTLLYLFVLDALYWAAIFCGV